MSALGAKQTSSRSAAQFATAFDIARQATGVQSVGMNSLGMISVLAALLVPALHTSAQPSQPTSNLGREHVIIKSYETSQTGDGSSGSSRGQDTLVERVVRVRDGGLELEYDLPNSVTAEDRARSWQFPVRIFKPPAGPMQLLNPRRTPSTRRRVVGGGRVDPRRVWPLDLHVERIPDRLRSAIGDQDCRGSGLELR